MCLRWTSRVGILKIICTIDDLYLPVSIQNNLGVEIARCSVPFPSSFCTPRNNNTTILQNLTTNETIVDVRRKIDRSMNGIWTCRHGHGISKYKANIEINIPATKELRCLKVISLNIVTGVIISVVMASICLIITWKCTCTQKEGQFYKRIVSLTKMIDDWFGAQKVDNHLVKCTQKDRFFISFVLLVFAAGVVIGVLEKDLCTGSVVFLVLGIVLCLTLLILFLRPQGNGGALQLFNSSAGNASSSNYDEAHYPDNVTRCFSVDEQSSDDSDTYDINAHRHHFATEITSDSGSGDKKGTISCNRIEHGSDNGKTNGLHVGYRKEIVLSDMEKLVSDDESAAIAKCYQENITGPKYVKQKQKPYKLSVRQVKHTLD
ncbi:unnamed protein product [Mytilus edulis]|uniref:Uncharacterized protein n=1 Tax=Mytilus edulis TaxID=6550 RepID=A0A8S3SLM6_MYTED|nr:unnamed protein product [Mytilus edulis]